MLSKLQMTACCCVLLGACVLGENDHHEVASPSALDGREATGLASASGSSSPLSRTLSPFWWGALRYGENDGLIADVLADSFELAAGLIEGLRLDQGSWCEESQRLLIQSPALMGRIAVTHERFDDVLSFAWAKPSLSGNATEGVTIRTVALPLFSDLPRILFPFLPASAESIACKMKSEEAVMNALGAEASTEPLSCADLNEAAWQWAWDQLPVEVRQRLDQRGVQVEFLPDREFSSGLGWVGASLEIRGPTAGSQTYQVQSPRLLTPTSALLGLGGNHYCKLLSPARAVDWLLGEGAGRVGPI